VTHTRPAAVAGMFYPAQPEVLRRMVDGLLAEVPREGSSTSAPPKVLVVPHAGYVYSGPTAARAYARLTPWRDQIQRVILLGPTHRVAVNGLAVPESTAFATPLGAIDIDQAALQAIGDLPFVVASDRVHAQEHSIEVHLPFLQRVLAPFTLLPIAVGDAPATAVAAVLERLWGGPETLIVISSDLSHFHDYETARQRDRHTCQRILARDPQLKPTDACGAYPLNGLLLFARQHDLQPELIHCCNSGDTAGDKARVVGYASFAFGEKAAGHA
jgi:MEMO1 family protein